MNRGAADLRRSNLYSPNDACMWTRVERRVDSQCQTHDKSGDNSQSHDSSRIKYFPFISCGPLQVGDPSPVFASGIAERLDRLSEC